MSLSASLYVREVSVVTVAGRGLFMALVRGPWVLVFGGPVPTKPMPNALNAYATHEACAGSLASGAARWAARCVLRDWMTHESGTDPAVRGTRAAYVKTR